MNATVKNRPGASAADIAWRGIEKCREGDWKDGMSWLGMAANADVGKNELPSLFYAYLGYGVARYQGKPRDGLRLCRHALELEFYQPENYLFLARTHSLLGDRRAAIDVLDRGLQVDPTHHDLLRLRTELGQRKRPVLPFLTRHNPLNRLLGQLRHKLTTKSSSDPDTTES